MNTPRLAMPISLRRLGWQGGIGLALLAGCLAFHLAVLEPAQEALRHAQHRVGEMQKRPICASCTAVSAQAGSRQQMDRFYAFFRPPGSPQIWLRQIYRSAALQGLTLERGDYRMAASRLDRLSRYQVELPVRGHYAQVRRFVTAVLKDVPVAAVDDVMFERQKVGEPQVSATVRMSLYMEIAP